MKVLILGGGVFLGAATLDAALGRGHTVTVFNRGRSRTAWPAGVDVLSGDRQGDLAALASRRWDAVVDTCGYVPAEVASSAEALRGCGAYLFVSSISAYASFAHAPVTEDDALADFACADPADRDAALYGVQKAGCEAQVRRVFGARALIVRPGLIVGPGDPTGRFSHWPWRMAEGGEMLVPDAPADAPLQFIDVRDLGDWMVRLLERGAAGVFNATGPASAPAGTWDDLLRTCVEACMARGRAPAIGVRVAEAFIAEQAIEPWTELPLWLPSTDAEHLGFARVDVRHAVAAGLSTRPWRDTVDAVLDEGVPAADDRRRAGKLDREREARTIAAWRTHQADAPGR